MRRTPRLVAPTLLAALILTGCLPADPTPTPPPTPDATPVFASEEEALAAAEEVYSAFQAAADQIIREGGAAPERVARFLSPELYDRELAGYEQLRANGWHGVGESSFALTLQSYDEDIVVTYACDDLSNTDVVDSAGNSVVRPDRSTRIAYEVEFAVAEQLRIVRKDVWDGGGVC